MQHHDGYEQIGHHTYPDRRSAHRPARAPSPARGCRRVRRSCLTRSARLKDSFPLPPVPHLMRDPYLRRESKHPAPDVV